MRGFADAALWVDVPAATSPANGTVTLTFESSPSRDEADFVAVAPAITLTAAQAPLLVKTIRLPSTAPLSRWLRWKLRTTGSPSGTWDATFRVRGVGGRTPFFLPNQVSGCSLWLRSDLGITAAFGATVGTWTDQSGLGNNASAGTTAPVYNAPSTTPLPRVTSSAGAYMTGAFASAIGAHTAFVVCVFPSVQAQAGAFAATTGAGQPVNTGFSMYSETGPGSLVGRTSSGGSNADATTSNLTSEGKVGIYSSAASSNQNVDLWVNGTQLGTNTVSFALSSSTNYILFALGLPLVYNLIGDIYEVIVYNRLLSSAERTLVHRYLGGRYGIAVA